jgi:peptidyl-prolyl cis-trans isomerase SurA
MKPGKKEKIRFGQAPRETLPAAETKTEDAGASGTASEGTQVATNNQPSDLKTMNPDGTIANPDQATAKQKTRYSDRAKQPKDKKSKEKIDPFAPPPVTADEVATQQQQAKPLGLNGDTSKVKKPNPAKTGPKRRMTDEKKENEKPANGTEPNSAPANTPPPAPATTGESNAPASAPAPSPAPAPAGSAPAQQ